MASFVKVGLCISAWLALAFMPKVASAHSLSLFKLHHYLGMIAPPGLVLLNTSESSQPGITPSGCKVEKGFLVHRHGSNEPFNGPNELIKELTTYINDHVALFSIPQVEPPPAFSFPKNGGWNNAFTTYSLTTPGRQQLFRRRVALKRDYPYLFTNQILASDVGRIVESARWFMFGYYGSGADSTATLNRIAQDPSVASWITPMYTCGGWDFSFFILGQWQNGVGFTCHK